MQVLANVPAKEPGRIPPRESIRSAGCVVARARGDAAFARPCGHTGMSAEDITEKAAATAAVAGIRLSAKAKCTRKKPSRRARSCGPLLNPSTSSQQAASANTSDHLVQRGTTKMRCGQGPGAPDGAFTGQRRAAPAQRHAAPCKRVRTARWDAANARAPPTCAWRCSAPGAARAVPTAYPSGTGPVPGSRWTPRPGSQQSIA